MQMEDIGLIYIYPIYPMNLGLVGCATMTTCLPILKALTRFPSGNLPSVLTNAIVVSCYVILANKIFSPSKRLINFLLLLDLPSFKAMTIVYGRFFVECDSIVLTVLCKDAVSASRSELLGSWCPAARLRNSLETEPEPGEFKRLLKAHLL